jgi:PncC family amidohydrolase
VAMARAVQAVALRSGITIATAESCTGGLIGHVLTEVPGSSAYYVGGVISYADDVKAEALGVDRGLIEGHGAVSEPVAAAMADGARTRFDADVAAAVTGIAGPAGDTTDKPVGLTYVAVATPDGTVVRRHVWAGDRSANKRASAAATLELLLERLSAPTEPDPTR